MSNYSETSSRINSLFIQGVAQHQRGQMDEAQRIYESVLAQEPTHFDALQLLATTHAQRGEHQQAISLFQKALMIDQKNPTVFSNMGLSQRALEQCADAFDSFQKALAIDDGHFLALFNLTEMLIEQERYHEALPVCQMGAARHPSHAIFLYREGQAHEGVGEFQKALQCYERTVQIDPKNLDARFRAGNMCAHIGRFDEAQTVFDQVLAINPLLTVGYLNKGATYTDMGDSAAAIESYSTALNIDPSFADAQYNRGRVFLANCRFKEGFSDYRSRWRAQTFSAARLRTAIPLLNRGHTVDKALLWGEQGLGDEVFYSGLIPQAGGVAKNLSIAVDKRLHVLYARSFPHVHLVDRKRIKLEIEEPQYDGHLPLGDLAYFLDFDEPRIRESRGPFLVPDLRLKNSLSETALFQQNKIVCGVSWRSSSGKDGAASSLELASLVEALETPGIAFVNLQYGEVSDEIQALRDHTGIVVHQLPDIDLFQDIESLVALISACSAVISIGNVTAHLAGAIGKQGAVLCPFGSSRPWYWHLGHSTSLWYPSLKMFDQASDLSWRGAIKSSSAWLKSLTQCEQESQ